MPDKTLKEPKGFAPIKSAEKPIPETQPTPVEAAVEVGPAPTEKVKLEKESGFLDETIDGLKKTLRRPKKKKPNTIPQVRDELTIKIEKIMAEDLVDAYKELTPLQQQEFKIKGEQTALQIRQLLKATHVKIKKIFQLIFDWLKMLPGINKFFLEQEAKIKADKIVGMK